MEGPGAGALQPVEFVAVPSFTQDQLLPSLRCSGSAADADSLLLPEYAAQAGASAGEWILDDEPPLAAMAGYEETDPLGPAPADPRAVEPPRPLIKARAIQELIGGPEETALLLGGQDRRLGELWRCSCGQQFASPHALNQHHQQRLPACAICSVCGLPGPREGCWLPGNSYLCSSCWPQDMCQLTWGGSPAPAPRSPPRLPQKSVLLPVVPPDSLDKEKQSFVCRIGGREYILRVKPQLEGEGADGSMSDLTQSSTARIVEGEKCMLKYLVNSAADMDVNEPVEAATTAVSRRTQTEEFICLENLEASDQEDEPRKVQGGSESGCGAVGVKRRAQIGSESCGRKLLRLPCEVVRALEENSGLIHVVDNKPRAFGMRRADGQSATEEAEKEQRGSGRDTGGSGSAGAEERDAGSRGSGQSEGKERGIGTHDGGSGESQGKDGDASGKETKPLSCSRVAEKLPVLAPGMWKRVVRVDAGLPFLEKNSGFTVGQDGILRNGFGRSIVVGRGMKTAEHVRGAAGRVGIGRGSHSRLVQIPRSSYSRIVRMPRSSISRTVMITKGQNVFWNGKNGGRASHPARGHVVQRRPGERVAVARGQGPGPARPPERTNWLTGWRKAFDCVPAALADSDSSEEEEKATWEAHPPSPPAPEHLAVLDVLSGQFVVSPSYLEAGRVPPAPSCRVPGCSEEACASAATRGQCALEDVRRTHGPAARLPPAHRPRRPKPTLCTNLNTPQTQSVRPLKRFPSQLDALLCDEELGPSELSQLDNPGAALCPQSNAPFARTSTRQSGPSPPVSESLRQSNDPSPGPVFLPRPSTNAENVATEDVVVLWSSEDSSDTVSSSPDSVSQRGFGLLEALLDAEVAGEPTVCSSRSTEARKTKPQKAAQSPHKALESSRREDKFLPLNDREEAQQAELDSEEEVTITRVVASKSQVEGEREPLKIYKKVSPMVSIIKNITRESQNRALPLQREYQQGSLKILKAVLPNASRLQNVTLKSQNKGLRKVYLQKSLKILKAVPPRVSILQKVTPGTALPICTNKTQQLKKDSLKESQRMTSDYSNEASGSKREICRSQQKVFELQKETSKSEELLWNLQKRSSESHHKALESHRKKSKSDKHPSELQTGTSHTQQETLKLQMASKSKQHVSQSQLGALEFQDNVSEPTLNLQKANTKTPQSQKKSLELQQKDCGSQNKLLSQPETSECRKNSFQSQNKTKQETLQLREGMCESRKKTLQPQEDVSVQQTRLSPRQMPMTENGKLNSHSTVEPECASHPGKSAPLAASLTVSLAAKSQGASSSAVELQSKSKMSLLLESLPLMAESNFEAKSQSEFQAPRLATVQELRCDTNFDASSQLEMSVTTEDESQSHSECRAPFSMESQPEWTSEASRLRVAGSHSRSNSVLSATRKTADVTSAVPKCKSNCEALSLKAESQSRSCSEASQSQESQYKSGIEVSATTVSESQSKSSLEVLPLAEQSQSKSNSAALQLTAAQSPPPLRALCLQCERQFSPAERGNGLALCRRCLCQLARQQTPEGCASCGRGFAPGAGGCGWALCGRCMRRLTGPLTATLRRL